MRYSLQWELIELFAVVKDYTYALDTLDAYDYQSLEISDTTLQAFLFQCIWKCVDCSVNICIR